MGPPAAPAGGRLIHATPLHCIQSCIPCNCYHLFGGKLVEQVAQGKTQHHPLPADAGCAELKHG